MLQWIPFEVFVQFILNFIPIDVFSLPNHDCKTSLCVCWCGASIAVVSGIPVHPKKIRKIPKNTQNSSKYTQNYTQVYFIPEIQRKWYTEYPYLSYNIPYSPCIPYTPKPWPTLTWIVRSAECYIVMLYHLPESLGEVVAFGNMIKLHLKMMPNFWFQKRNLLLQTYDNGWN